MINPYKWWKASRRMRKHPESSVAPDLRRVIEAQQRAEDQKRAGQRKR